MPAPRNDLADVTVIALIPTHIHLENNVLFPAARNSASTAVRAGQRRLDRAGATVCKTVGSAYDGPNPPYATPVEASP